jgi:hypothetical protein
MPGITWRRGFRSKDGQTIEVEEAVIERKDLEEIISGAVVEALDEYRKANEGSDQR